MVDTSAFGPVQAKLLEQNASLFHSNGGYVIIDNFFSPAVAESFRSELAQLRASNKMKPNCVQFNHNGASVTVQKPFIHEADLFDAAYSDAQLPTFQSLYQHSADQLVEALEAHKYATRLQTGVSGRVLKLQYNDGHGGCFPFHYDNPGPPNKRALTCLVYLNPGWSAGDGGELQLQPFLGVGVTVAPVMNRLVVFASDKILHRVLKNHRPRLCFTVWIDGEDVNDREASCLRLSANDFDDIRALPAKLSGSPAQRLLARATYAEMFERSLVECMGSSDELQILLSQHYTHLDKVRNNAKLQKLVQVLRVLRNSRSQEGASA